TAPYDLERNAREVKKCAAQGFVRNLEIDYVNRSGQVTPIEINATVVGSGGSARILSLCRDITERKRAEQALRESVERFRQIAESAGEWIWEEDAEGLYTYSSPVVEQILGYKPEELVGKKHFYDLFAPYVREEIKKAAFGRALRKEAFRKLANPVVCKDGRVIILETSGVPILDQEGRLLGYRGADTDITERKRADDRLRSQAQLLGCVSESVVATDLDDHILYWGRGAEELYGYAAAEVMGKPYRDFAGSIEPVDNDAFKREIIAKGAWRGEHVQRKRDGTTFWSSTVISLVTDEQGRPAGFIGIDDDITERRKAEARVRQLNRLLRTISDINQLMVREPNRDRLLLEACRILTEHGGFRMAWVGMAEKATGHVRPVAAAGLVDGYLDEAVIRFDDTPEGRGPTGACIRTGSHVVSADLTSDPSYAPWREAALKRGYRSSAAFPLRVRDEIVGALNVYVAEVGVIGDEETGLLDELANDLGYALEVIQDRQERMQAEEALRESEEKYRTLVERANDGVIIVQDAIVKFANRRMAELDGSRVEQIVGTPFTDHVHPTELPRLAENYQRRMRGEPVPATYETVLRRRDGSPAPAELNAGLIMYEGRPADMVIIRDITERKRAEEKSKEQYEKLRRWHEVTLDREGRVAELKREVNELAKRLDEKPRYGGEEKG
ncbi:MAG: PAS domain S-box protein, partial [Verrucomicrobia bacterium]|nr:PAS domain S-box protein [Verrucomicrobiota bacterium]